MAVHADPALRGGGRGDRSLSCDRIYGQKEKHALLFDRDDRNVAQSVTQSMVDPRMGGARCRCGNADGVRRRMDRATDRRAAYDRIFALPAKTAFESALKVKNIDTAICALALRRVLEAICKDKGAEGNSLEKMIANMIDREILPGMFDDACWIIRQLGNSAAHADKKVFSMHQVDQTIEFVQNIINYLYTLPVKMKRLRDAIEAEKQAGKAAAEEAST